jgi:hypothetical protein
MLTHQVLILRDHFFFEGIFQLLDVDSFLTILLERNTTFHTHQHFFRNTCLYIYMDLSIRVIMCIYFLVYICPFFTRLLHFFKANTVSFNRNTNCFTCHQKINKPNWHNHIKNNRTWLNSCIRITLQEHVHPDTTSKQLILTPGAHSVGKL